MISISTDYFEHFCKLLFNPTYDEINYDFNRERIDRNQYETNNQKQYFH